MRSLINVRSAEDCGCGLLLINIIGLVNFFSFFFFVNFLTELLCSLYAVQCVWWLGREGDTARIH